MEESFIFSSSPIELKEEGGNFFVEGHISTSDLDLVNDIVTKECIMDMAEQMRERTIKLDVEHESFKGNTDLEKEINKTIIPAAKIDDFLVDKKGLKVRAMLNKHIKRFNEVKDSIKDGFLDAFSIAFIPVKSTAQIREGQEIRMLDKVNLLNIAFTGNPVNTHSTMTNVFAKSLEFLNEQEKAKPKTPPKRKIPESEYEDEEDEEKGCPKKPKKKKKEEEKNHNHSKDDIIKLEEVKQMTEEDKEEEKPSESEEKPEVEKKDEEPEEEKKEEKPEEKEEAKDEEPGEKEEESEESSSEKVEAKDIEKLKKDMMEVKAALKRPMLKSRVEQKDKSKEFAEEKSLNPLDVIA